MVPERINKLSIEPNPPILRLHPESVSSWNPCIATVAKYIEIIPQVKDSTFAVSITQIIPEMINKIDMMPKRSNQSKYVFSSSNSKPSQFHARSDLLEI